MKYKRFSVAAVTAALICSLCLNVSAAVPSSFQDISDPVVAVNADILRLMGVVSGIGDNRFDPEANLTRAEFCVMVTNFIQRDNEVVRYASRTIFRDVSGSHWARGYINLMATAVGGKPAMIAGMGDGSFAPGEKVTVAQATTVLLRVLGYTTEDTGFVWPQSYMEFAGSIGLLDGVPQKADQAITRAQAAQLLVNALGSPEKGGNAYYTSLGSSVKDVILLAVNVATDDNSSEYAIRTSNGGEAYLAAAGDVSPYALQGKRGTLVLNDRSEIVTFLPEDSSAVTITLLGAPQPSYFKDTSGKRYTMSASTMLYSADRAQGVSYIEGYTSLRSGTQVTLFTQSGKVTALYAAGSTSASEANAVVVDGAVNSASFYSLTGGAENCRILKNRQAISANQIQPYDVVTYDRINNTLIVSDLRISCVYEDASPNAKAPQTIQALGTQFEVLDSAWDNMDSVKLGDNVCLLLTADGKVAGIKKVSSSCRSTAVALAGESGAEVYLPNGGSFSVHGMARNQSEYIGQLVTVSSTEKGRLTFSKLGFSPTGDLDLTNMMLGEDSISSGVRVFDQPNHLPASPMEISLLEDESISRQRIKAVHKDTSGYVDYIVLNNVTGNGYIYGLCTVETSGAERLLTFENGTEQGFRSFETPYRIENGSFAGLARAVNGNIRGMLQLKKIEHVSPADFFESHGNLYVQAEGAVYPVSEDVVCHKDAVDGWFEQTSGRERLAACKAYSDNLTIYLDPIIGHVRIVSAR